MLILLLSQPAYATHFRFETFGWEAQFTADTNGRGQTSHLRARLDIVGEGFRSRSTYACSVRSGNLGCRVEIEIYGEAGGEICAQYAETRRSARADYCGYYASDIEIRADGWVSGLVGDDFGWWVEDVEGATPIVAAAGGTAFDALLLDLGADVLLEHAGG